MTQRDPDAKSPSPGAASPTAPLGEDPHATGGEQTGARRRASSAHSAPPPSLPLSFENLAALLTRADAALTSGGVEEAEGLYRIILSHQPDNSGALNNLGFLLRNRGQHQEAAVLFQKALPGSGQPAITWNNLGYSLHILGRSAEAEAAFRQAIALDPGYPGPHNNLGNLLRDAQRPDEAAACYREALRLNPAFVEARNNLGEALRQAGAHADALAAFDAALGQAPHIAEIHANRGRLLIDMGHYDQALANLDQALAIQPRLALAHNNRGVALEKRGRPAEALTAFETATALDPDFAQAHNNRGEALRKAGRIPEALAAYEAALARAPDFAEALNNMGVAQRKGGEVERAAETLTRAAGLDPDNPETATNLGNVLMDLNRFDEAVNAHHRALALDPTRAQVHTNLGKTYFDAGHFDQAMRHYDLALAQDQQGALTHLNRAYLLLLQGDWEAGWVEHEWRWREDQSRPHRRDFPQPQWEGEPLPGQTLLLYAEQGLGDTLQFARFAAWAKQRSGARIILETQPVLAGLLAQLEGVDLTIRRGDPLPPFDRCIPLISLPGLFGLTPENIPLAKGYLRARPGGSETDGGPRRPGAKNTAPKAPRIGLVWRGNPGHLNDRNRSIDPVLLEPLITGIPSARWVCLQAGDTPRELDPFGWAASIERPGIPDFIALARLMEGLDLVITVDTAAAHLAGALGVPVWTLVTYVPDWRWLLGSETTPWYKSMRLFRQRERGEWAEVIERLLRAARDFRVDPGRRLSSGN